MVFMEETKEVLTNQQWLNVDHNDQVLHGVGIVTGFLEKEAIWERITEEQRHKVKAVGNLYSPKGIAYMIGNLYANPGINHLILVKADPTKQTGILSPAVDRLEEYFQTGVPEFPMIFDQEQVAVQEVLDPFFQHFHKQVTVTTMSQLDQTLQELSVCQENWTKPKKIPMEDIKLAGVLPSEKMGMLVRAATMEEAFGKILYLIQQYGTEKESNFHSIQKELLQLHVVLEQENYQQFQIPRYFQTSDTFRMSFTKEALETYADALFNGVLPEGQSYTYGQRLNAYPPDGISQLNYIVDTLRENPNSRQAIASLWQPVLDPKASDVPCFTKLDAKIQEGKLYLHARFRSNDMFEGWPKNVYALLKVQDYLCRELGVSVGPLATTASSAHVYDRNFGEMEQYLKEHTPSFLQADPRGNFTVHTEDGMIEVRLYGTDGSFQRFFRGKSSTLLRHQVTPYVSDFFHAYWLGTQIKQASIANQMDVSYRTELETVDTREYPDLVETLSSEKMGIVLRADTIEEAWGQLLETVERYGTWKQSTCCDFQKELLSVHTIIDPNQECMQEIPEEFVQYADALLTGKGSILDGKRIHQLDHEDYCYVSSLQSVSNLIAHVSPEASHIYGSQIDYMIAKLRESSETRQATTSLWIPSIDGIVTKRDVPSLIELDANIQNDRLYLGADFRSNDVYNWWPKNMYGLLKIQEYMCQELTRSGLSIQKGLIETTATSAHFYAKDQKQILAYLKDHPVSYCQPDERGSFLIEVDNGTLKASLNNEKAELLETFESDDFMEFGKQITPYLSNKDHAYYLGEQAVVAKTLDQFHQSFVQDRAADFSVYRKSFCKKK